MSKNNTTKKYEVHIVSQTHWDREWYSSFQEYRIRLVKLFDKLLNILDTNLEYKYFIFDGQTVVLEDYLEIRPEKRKKIIKYVKEGRLLIGPWYILPDEFLVSGESTIRNLLIGHKIAKEFGKVMKVGYIPDPFGHISQLPQILNGFDINSFIFTRGLGDEGEKLGSEFIWQSPDGSEVIAIHQIAGYGNAAGLGYVNCDISGSGKLDLENGLKRAKDLILQLTKYAKTKYLLFNNGVDHYEPQPELPEIISYLNKNVDNTKFIHSNFETFINKIKSAKLNKYKGELRSARYAPLLPGVISARMYLKQANHRTQNIIENYTEPLGAFSFLEGGKYPEEFLFLAWKYLIQSHPHDSICGCSIDEVHKDVIQRLQWSYTISNTLLNESMNYLVSKIHTKLNNSTEEKVIPVIVFNPLNWVRNEVVNVELHHNPDKEQISTKVESGSVRKKEYTVKSGNEEIFPVQNTDIELKEPYWTPYEGLFYKEKISFFAKDVPACGYKIFYLNENKNYSDNKYKTDLKIFDNQRAENEFLQLSINNNGTLNIKDKINNINYDKLLIYEDTEDIGDEYNWSPAEFSTTITSVKEHAEIDIINQGPLYVVFRIKMDFPLPESITSDRKRRKEKLVICQIETYVTIYSGWPLIEIRTVFNNNVKDHRLRVLFPANIVTDYSNAEGQFDVIKRSIKLPEGKNWTEQPSPTYPHQTFVSIDDGEKGMTVINEGLPEYEVKKEIIEGKQEGTVIALTLLRSVGWLSRPDLLTRKGNAGPQLETFDSQCPGKNEFRYAVMFHKGSWEKAKVWRYSHNFNVPLLCKATDLHRGDIQENNLSFISLEPDNLVISAIKKCEYDNGLIIRFYNTTSNKVKGKISVYKPLKKVWLTNMNEEIQKEIKLKNKNIVEIDVGPYKIITLKIVTD